MIKADELRSRLMKDGLSRNQIDDNPYHQFEHWYQQTLDSDIAEPTAMSLATVDADGYPWQRMVLLKSYDENGFVFFTNYSSKKAEHIKHNPNVSLLFPWYPMGRQVRIVGKAEKVSTAESLAYFSSRPRGSQLGAWTSHQSKVIKTRALLDGMLDQMKRKFASGEIPLPDFWGGFRVIPESFEFWQARESRLHDRFSCTKNDEGLWCYERLAP